MAVENSKNVPLRGGNQGSATVVNMHLGEAGKPVAKLVPVAQAPRRFKLGSAKGEFVVPDDFNDPLPKEIEDLFYK